MPSLSNLCLTGECEPWTNLMISCFRRQDILFVAVSIPEHALFEQQYFERHLPLIQPF